MTTRFGAQAPVLQTPTAGTAPTPFHVHLGLIGDPRTTVAIQWRTRDEETRSTLVRYAAGDALPPASLTTIREGVTFTYESLGDEHPRIHETHLCELVADTVYSYQVGSSFPGHETWPRCTRSAPRPMSTRRPTPRSGSPSSATPAAATTCGSS